MGGGGGGGIKVNGPRKVEIRLLRQGPLNCI